MSQNALTGVKLKYGNGGPKIFFITVQKNHGGRTAPTPHRGRVKEMHQDARKNIKINYLYVRYKKSSQ